MEAEALAGRNTGDLITNLNAAFGRHIGEGAIGFVAVEVGKGAFVVGGRAISATHACQLVVDVEVDLA